MSDKMQEEFRDDDGYSFIPDPVEVGSNKLPNSNDNAEPMPKLSKAGMIGAIVSAAHKMDKDTLSAVFNATMKKAGLPTGALKESADVSAFALVSEDLSELLGSATDLSEDFRTRASALFEAAVNAKVVSEVSALEEAFEAGLADIQARLQEETLTQIDEYLTAVVAEWVEENNERLGSTIKGEIAESFMDSLRDLLEEHYIEIPNERVDVVEALSLKNDELQEELQRQAETLSALQEEIAVSKKKTAITEAAVGMTETQADRFALLAEGLQFDGSFAAKLSVIKESVVGVVAKANTEQMLTEEVEAPAPKSEAPTLHPDVAAVLGGMSRLKSGR